MRILILGATGRTGSALLGELPPDVDAVAALRRYDDVVRLPRSSCGLTHVVLTLEDAATLRRAVDGVDVIVNAIRLREDIAPTALIGIHLRLLNAAADREPGPLIVSVGGAGSLRPRTAHVSGSIPRSQPVRCRVASRRAPARLPGIRAGWGSLGLSGPSSGIHSREAAPRLIFDATAEWRRNRVHHPVNRLHRLRVRTRGIRPK